MTPAIDVFSRRIWFGGRSERALSREVAIVFGEIVVVLRFFCRGVVLRRTFVAVYIAEIETGVDFGLTLARAFTRYVTRHLGPKVFTTEIDAHLRVL